MESGMPYSLLETTQNTRDLGHYISAASGERLQLWRVLRSDVPCNPSDSDIGLLKAHRIFTIIDMRCEENLQKQPSGFAGREPFSYISIPIREGSSIPESTDAVSTGYLQIAQSGNIPEVFKAVAAAKNGVMINCTAGKDRTGVVSAVLLGLCGVSEADIVADYMLTKANSQKRFERIHQKYPNIDMNIVIPSERYMREFIHLLKAKYGGFRQYLLAIGVTSDEIDGIKEKLL